MADKKIYTTLAGSSLYGTRTPESDRDIKHVVLPDIRSLLRGDRVVNVFKTTNETLHQKNSSSDVDEEHIPIQVFARDFLGGQSYAIELAFSIDGFHSEQTFYEHPSNRCRDRFYMFAEELRTRFLTSNLSSLIGYAVHQTSLYSFKGERLNAVNAVLDVLERNSEKITDASKLADAVETEEWKVVEESHGKYFQFTQYHVGMGKLAPCIVLMEKILPMAMPAKDALSAVSRSKKMYGARAAAASKDNVDWKAMSHAVRIINQGIELLSDHTITLPRPEAEHLLRVKRGEISLDSVKSELVEKLDELKALEAESLLPKSEDLTEEFDRFLEGWLLEFYNLEFVSEEDPGQAFPKEHAPCDG